MSCLKILKKIFCRVLNFLFFLVFWEPFFRLFVLFVSIWVDNIIFMFPHGTFLDPLGFLRSRGGFIFKFLISRDINFEQRYWAFWNGLHASFRIKVNQLIACRRVKLWFLTGLFKQNILFTMFCFLASHDLVNTHVLILLIIDPKKSTRP